MNSYISKETTSALEQLSRRVQDGQLIGIAFVGMLRGRKFTAGWAGEAGQDPLFTMGALQHLNHDLVEHTRSKEL